MEIQLSQLKFENSFGNSEYEKIEKREENISANSANEISHQWQETLIHVKNYFQDFFSNLKTEPKKVDLEKVQSSLASQIKKIKGLNQKRVEKQKASENGLTGAHRGFFTVFTMIMLSALCALTTSVSAIYQSVFHPDDRIQTNVNIGLGSSTAVFTLLTFVGGLFYKRNRDIAKTLTQLKPNEVEEIRKLLNMVEAVAELKKISTEHKVDLDKSDPEELLKQKFQGCLMTIREIPAEYSEKGSTEDWAVSLSKFLPKDTSLRKTFHTLKTRDRNQERLPSVQNAFRPSTVKLQDDITFESSAFLSPPTVGGKKQNLTSSQTIEEQADWNIVDQWVGKEVAFLQFGDKKIKRTDE